jgi:hypothetical protein
MWSTFLIGILVGLAIALIIAKPTAIRLGYVVTKVPNLRPARVVSAEGLQPLLRRLMEAGDDGERLHLWSKEPEFTVYFERKAFKSSPDRIFLRVVFSHTSAELYERARCALDDHGVEYDACFTPKRQDPKHLQIIFEAGPLVPAAASIAVVAVFRGIGANPKDGIFVSPWGNIDWSRL